MVLENVAHGFCLSLLIVADSSQNAVVHFWINAVLASGKSLTMSIGKYGR